MRIIILYFTYIASCKSIMKHKMEDIIVIKVFSLMLFSMLSMMFCNIASAVSCSYIKSGVFDNEADLIYSACLDANAQNDSQKAMNSGDFFGISTWTLLEKVDDGGSDGSINLDVQSIGDVSGSFSFDSSIWDDYEEIVVVLKGGKTADGSKWSAYLLNQDVYEGSWIFGFGNKGQLKDLSHLTIYGSRAAVIPAPAALLLFGSGLLALFAVSRRKL